MIRLSILLVLAIDLANGQLNYEGNPFTEYTEYIAEESNLSERSTKGNDASIDVTNPRLSSRPLKLYPSEKSESDVYPHRAAEVDDHLKLQERPSPSIRIAPQTNARQGSARQLTITADQDSSIDPAEVALNTFLNSKTPEESRESLDDYLRSQQRPEAQSRSSNVIIGQDRKSIEPQDVQSQSVYQVEQRPQSLMVPQVSQQVQLMPQVDHGQVVSQLLPQVDQRQQLMPPAEQAYGYVAQPAAVVQPVIRAPAGVILGQGILHPVPLVPNYQQTRNDITPAMWRDRMRRIRGHAFPYAQSRIAPTLYKGPIAVPIKHKGPIEVIYTKPPGLHRGPPVISNPPVPYEDASAWFPNVDRPPSHKDIYYSQLYSQSYDPHYYNYIAATGKIRPYLYGKLGKYQEEQDGGIWSELYRGFKKHGLKNIMTPTFLLGMTLPVVTLMLSALVQKRSIGRSDEARDLNGEDHAMREYLERLQRAMECYAGRNTRDAKPDGC